MGLFTKKICGVCGEKLGLLDLMPIELTDGYLCKDCRKKCSPFLSDDLVNGKWSSADIKNHYSDLQKQKEKLAKEFTETDCVINSKSGEKNGEKLISIDKNHGWFTVRDIPEIFELSKVAKVTTEYMPSGDDDHDMHLKFEAPRPGMSVPDRGETLISMSAIIILEGHPYADRIDVPISVTGQKLIELYQHYLTNIYDTAAEIYDKLLSF